MADQKISELTAAEAATADDLIVLVDDPSGTPVTKKLTIAELATAVAGDKLPLAGGTMTGAILFGTGSQNINVGSFDNSTGGSSGISLVCAVGYELNWQGGHISNTYGSTNYAILCDSSITLAATKRITFGDATYLDSKLPVVVQNFTASGTLETNAATCDIVDCEFEGTAMIGNPTNSANGQTILWRISRAGGAQTVTLDSDFVIVSGSIDNTENMVTFVRATYSVAAGEKWFADVTNVEVIPPAAGDVALLLHMDGADGSTVFADSSSHGLTVTAYGNARVSTAQSVFGEASALFDGDGDNLTVTGDFTGWNTSNYTIEFWLRANEIYGYYPLVYCAGGFNIHIYNSGDIHVNDTASGSSIGGGTAIVANAWTHIAVVRLAGTITLYQDGVIIGTTTQTPGAGGSTLEIGTALDGYIDELRIVKGVAIYTAAFTPSSGPAQFSQVQLLLPGNTATADASSYSRAVTANGASVSTAEKQFGAGSIAISGSGQYLAVASDAALNMSGDFVIEFWVRLADATAQGWFIGGPDNNSGYLMGGFNLTDSGQIWLGKAAIGWPLNFDGASLQDDTWHYIAIARQGSSNRLYVDGTQVGSTITDSTSWVANPTAVWIGSQNAGVSMDGYLDDFRITVGHARGYTGATITVPTAAFYTAPSIAALLLHMDGANASTTFADSSANALAVTAHGSAAISTAQSVFGGASAYFNGSAGASISFSDLGIGTSDYTIEFRFKCGTQTQYAQLIGNEANSSSATGFTVLFSNSVAGSLAMYHAGSLVFETSGGLNDNAWHHFAMVRASGAISVYIDGSVVDTATDNESMTDGDWYVGANFAFPGREYIGYVDELAVFEVAVYTGNFTPSAAPLT